nr:phosphatase PAP2 family protein [uncultured Cohaesibacter sp.]
MSLTYRIKSAFNRLKDQYCAFAHLRAVRSFHARSGLQSDKVIAPDWLLFFVSIVSLIALGMLFLDGLAGHWKATIAPDVYDIFSAITRWGKSENYLIPSGLAVLITAFLPWDRLNKSAKASLVQLQLMGLYIFIAVAGAGLTNNILKILIGRARPRHFEELGPLYFNPPGFNSGFQSFPSGHSTTAGAMAVALTLLFPRLKWFWIGAALWIGFSRIVVGAHYPSDVVAGFSYGALFAWLLAHYATKRRLLFRAQDGFIRLPKSGGFSFARLMKALHMLVQKA